MGRHADTTSTSRRLPRIAPRLLIAAGVVVLLLAGGGVWAALGATGGCPSTERVRVTVAPELGRIAGAALKGTLHAPDGTCVTAAVTGQQPLQTVGSLGALTASSLPQVWVPDASLWAARASGSRLVPAGSMASSPVVLATSRAAVDQLGWSATPPTWGQALAGQRPVALPDLAASATGLQALGAVRASLGGNEAADNAVVAAVLAAARSTDRSTADALADGRAGKADAPLVPVSEREVASSATSSLAAVYPADGSPRLDYPVLRVGSASGHRGAAVDVVVRALTSSSERTAARAAGFRDPSGAAPTRTGADVGVPAAAPKDVPLDPAALTGLLNRLGALSKPSRLLVVMDVSTSMRAPAGDGTRATLARDATKSALSLLPDSYAGGVWAFASHLQGAQDWQELAPIRAFGADAGDGRTQRQLLQQQFDSIPDRLVPGGTALYDTTLAAVRASREAYDPNEVSSVVLVTDGRNEDDAGIALPALLQQLRAEADPARPVKVIAIGLGPDADMDTLRQIADTTSGASYQALHPEDLQGVLVDAIPRRG